MRKSLAFLLALLMMLPLFGCVASEPQNEIADASAPSGVILAEELNPMATISASKYSSTVASANGFVRSGSYADKVMELETEDKLLHVKNNADGYYLRHILLRFDLTQLNLTKANRIQIGVYFEGGNLDAGDQVNGREEAVIIAYGVSNDWSPATLTYNNAPKYDASKPAGKADIPVSGYCYIDVTDYVFEQYDNGATEVSFRLAEKTVRTNQGEIFSNQSPKVETHPILRADYCPLNQSYITDIYEDAADNDALWAYAEEMYQDWYGRYQEILKRDNYSSQKITSPAADFSVTTQARGGKPTATLKTFPTRLATTIKGYTPEGAREESRYGGDMTAKRQEATGRFYTKKIDGRW